MREKIAQSSLSYNAKLFGGNEEAGDYMWVDELEAYVTQQLARLDLLKEDEINPEADDVVARLKMALRNELEASELAAFWISSTPEVDVKLGLARQAGDEAK